MQEVLHAAHQIAEAAGDYIRQVWAQPRIVEHKGAVDLVTDTDRAVEAQVVAALRERFPEHRIVAEEGSPEASSQGPTPTWFIDPVDGTTNFAHGYPHVAVSMGLAIDGVPVLGVVHDPMRRETFAACEGAGATLNGAPIGVSKTAGVDAALIGTGFPYDRRERPEVYLAYVADVMRRAQGIRRAGTAALDLCWVACGRLDGFWEFKLKPWDIAAGVAIVRQAGGRVSDCRGDDRLDLYAGSLLATNGSIHAELIDILAPRLAGTGT